MSLSEVIQRDMYAAMKAGEKARVAALRSALARLKDKRIAISSDLTESDELKVIRSLVKQHKESIEAYTGGGRQDLVDLEQAAREHLETYLPRMLSEKEVRALVTEVIADTGATGMSEIGKVMPQVMQRSAGLADGKLAQAIVLELLS